MFKIIGADQKQYGPVSEAEVRRWIGEGRLNPRSLAQREGSDQWQPLDAFPEFAGTLQAQSRSAPGPPGSPAALAEQEALAARLLHQAGGIDTGACLSASWSLFTANAGLLYGAVFIAWVVGTVCQFVPVLGLAYAVLRGVFFGGVYLVFLKRIRGEPARVGAAFRGFSVGFVQLLLAGLLVTLGSSLAMCCFILPGIYLYVAWTFALPLVADKGLEFWPAMELSRKVVTRNWLNVFALLLIAYLPFILGYLAIGGVSAVTLIPHLRDLVAGGPPNPVKLSDFVVKITGVSLLWGSVARLLLLLNLPFALGATMHAYETLFAERSPRAA